MAKAGLYHHISGKQDMLFQIMQYAMDELKSQVIVPVRLIADPEERLQEMVRLHIQGAIEHGFAFTIVMSEVSHLESAERKKSSNARRPIMSWLTRRCRNWPDKGDSETWASISRPCTS